MLRRLALLVPTLLGVSLMAFAVADLAPGDPAEEFLYRVLDRPPSAAELAATRADFGLDRPFLVQYASWVGNALQGNLGISYETQRPVVEDIGRRVPFTLELALPAGILALGIALVVGTISALYRNRFIDQVTRIVCLAGASIPGFWLALLLVVLFAVKLSVVPAAGRDGPASLLLPTLALSLPPAAVLARFIRSAMLETLGEEYVRTARAKGLSEALVISRHVMRNSMIAVLTAFTISVGHLLSGAVVIESIFVWPGLGTLALDAIRSRDYPIIQAFVLYAGGLFILINLVVDLSYTLIDPRVRVG